MERRGGGSLGYGGGVSHGGGNEGSRSVMDTSGGNKSYNLAHSAVPIEAICPHPWNLSRSSKGCHEEVPYCVWCGLEYKV